MFQPYDTSGDNAWLAVAIEEFHKHDLHRYDLTGQAFNNGLEPSSVLNTRLNMFSIKPMDATTDWQDLNERALFPPCTVCNKAFEPGNTFNHTIMTLHCNHSFHLKCIFSYWDESNRYQHSCPTCGLSPPMNHQLVGMSPGNNSPAFDTNNPSFVHNLFGWTPPPPNPAGTDFDIPHGQMPGAHVYWEREMTYINTYIETPFKWDAARATHRPFKDPEVPEVRFARDATARLMAAMPGTTGTGAAYYDSSRFDVDIEVGYLRHKRRVRDRNRRKRMQGRGVGGL
jgi:hypothetical protein